VRRRAWEVPPVFRLLQDQGRVEDAEMFRTFNMGIGYVLVLSPEHAAAVATRDALGDGVRIIGEIVAGEPGVELVA
jgi:phosphoribosylformylglycinamidine cyclo-ligase